MNLEPIVFTAAEQEKLNLMFEQWMYHDHLKALDKFKHLNAIAKPNGIVFIGDSITEGYPICEFLTSKHKLYNRGISAITSQQLLDHLAVHALDIKPSKVVILIGTNDIERKLSAEKTVENIDLLLKKIHQSLPETAVYLTSIYPVNEGKDYTGMVQSRTNQVIQSLNKKIKAVADSYKYVTYLDFYDRLLKNGQLNPDYTKDGLHLNMTGYLYISQFIQALVD